MLRVGLTGGLGSGKSTIGRLFSDLGAAVIDADAIGRRLMEPGEDVYDQIVASFGPTVVRADGSLDRRALAGLAFSGGRLFELNRIVHPAVIAAQEEWMRGIFAAEPGAVAIVESALVFEASRDASGAVPGWKNRFDRIILVTAPEDLKIRRFIERSLALGTTDVTALEADARRRLAAQIPDAEKAPHCDWILENSRDLSKLREEVTSIYTKLKTDAAR
jgi:dephospho-CoA kinase